MDKIDMYDDDDMGIDENAIEIVEKKLLENWATQDEQLKKLNTPIKELNNIKIENKNNITIQSESILHYFPHDLTIDITKIIKLIDFSENLLEIQEIKKMLLENFYQEILALNGILTSDSLKYIPILYANIFKLNISDQCIKISLILHLIHIIHKFLDNELKDLYYIIENDIINILPFIDGENLNLVGQIIYLMFKLDRKLINMSYNLIESYCVRYKNIQFKSNKIRIMALYPVVETITHDCVNNECRDNSTGSILVYLDVVFDLCYKIIYDIPMYKRKKKMYKLKYSLCILLNCVKQISSLSKLLKSDDQNPLKLNYRYQYILKVGITLILSNNCVYSKSEISKLKALSEINI